ncbi:energy transducer TonB [Shewanella xiamenensis]|uniref:Protein TonB n=1 Tax=Shewanella cutis TaxID=2766780 RepID=A0ABS9R3K7_9GAMM|nr:MULTISPECIES: energy transducer TonB [Shewanella]MCG9966398.1 energy transducer TonB [Shewanella sp. PS-2]MCR4536484.1 energy transducer TonB [Shewanella xiamenensis]MDI5874576.1 energy transducer TonB [Shewanella xiamenensis]WHF55516.1 energy transducer TonB [Shewanella xiamenensis]
MGQNVIVNRTGIIVVSALITLGLFVFMAQLIHNPQPLSGQASDAPQINILMSERTPIPPKETRKPEPPKPIPTRERVTTPGESTEVVDFSPQTFTPEMPIQTTLFTPSSMSAEALPLVQVSPRYPIEASQNGKEGYVVVGFDITAEGTVSNVRVLDANPKRVFDKAALSAVQNWKYKPKFDAGKAVPQLNQQVQLDFKLEQKI